MNVIRFDNVVKVVQMIKARKAASVEEASLKLAAESGDVVHPDDYKIVEDALKVRV